MEEHKTDEETPLLQDCDGKGGFRSLPFIIGNESAERMACIGLTPNMTLYLMQEYHMEITSASTVLFFWSAATNFTPLIWAVIADSYLGRFTTIGIGSVICLMGTILVWSTAIIPGARPSPSTAPTFLQIAFLYASFGLVSIGAGGIGSSSMAFGADQLKKSGFDKKPGVKEQYFGWYYASITSSILLGLTVTVYIQDNLGWAVGFAVPPLVMLFGTALFFLASSFYIKFNCNKSLVTGLFRVVVAAYRNRHLTGDLFHHSDDAPELLFPSQKLRFLNKACIISDPETDLTSDGRAADPWSLCTVQEVEELKALLRVLPIWSTGTIMSINISQNSIPLLQAVAMDKHITSNFSIPPASFSMFTILSVILWVAVYDSVFLPLASRVMGRPVRLSPKTRMGIGILLSGFGMIVAAVVESIRRSRALKGMPMSALWLVPFYCLMGFAEASNAIAQNELYFSELPRSMSSVALTLLGIGLGLANILASWVMNIVDDVSKRGGEESWVSDDINRGHLDYYYLVLAAITAADILYYVVCSSAYGPLKKQEETQKG